MNIHNCIIDFSNLLMSFYKLFFNVFLKIHFLAAVLLDTGLLPYAFLCVEFVPGFALCCMCAGL